MRILFSIALLGLLTSLSAQETITYPYNPDSDGDQFVGTSDVLSTLSTFDSEFEPSEIQIDDTNLSEIIIQMQEAIIALEAENASQAELILDLQASIESNEELNSYLDLLQTEIPDVSSFAQIDMIPDISGFALLTDIPDVSSFAQIDMIPDISGFALLTDIPDPSAYQIELIAGSTGALGALAYIVHDGVSTLSFAAEGGIVHLYAPVAQ